MRIANSYITDHPKRSLPGTAASPADQAGQHQRTQHARDSYARNAATAQVIDAEYVDLYSANTVALQQEPMNLNAILEPVSAPQTQASETRQKTNSSIGQYQMAPVDTPLPGTYLNIFA